MKMKQRKKNSSKIRICKNEMNLEIFQAFKTSLYKYIYIERESARAQWTHLNSRKF